MDLSYIVIRKRVIRWLGETHPSDPSDLWDKSLEHYLLICQPVI